MSRLSVDQIHAHILTRQGGLPGVRDDNIIESALGRPQNRWAYESGVDLFGLAAAYGFGIAMNHGYNDGNKRTAFMTMYAFLRKNGWNIITEEVEVVHIMVGLANKEIDENMLGTWLRTRCQLRTD